ncbi:AmmeMemoRadiSam system protein B [Acidilobus sp.]|uniref:AmmeMemoRadiSam system protein B n=1 Tax=Acidilobus sp. TaxID=1872109 RepID=UPI003CFF51E6
MQEIRKPAHAGSFYPADRDDLVKSIESSFLHRLGPGKLPQAPPSRNRTSVGYLVPHAGYMYSGPVAAHSYYNMAQEGAPKVVVVAGPNHTGLGEAASLWQGDAWETPLGTVEVDREVEKLIISNTKYFTFDNEAHLYEHSVEVQVPFLQYIFDSNFKLVPIVIKLQNPEVSKDLADALVKIINENGVDLLFVASSDMNHYEPHDVTVSKDNEALRYVESLDPEGLFRVLEADDITMCGPGPAMTLLYMGRGLGATRAVVLKHATSGDVTGEKDWVVGYASAVVPLPGK